MNERTILYSLLAERNFKQIARYISRKRSERIAAAYIERIRNACRDLAWSPHRGYQVPSLNGNLRRIGFEHSASITFRVDEDVVLIVKIDYRGFDREVHL